MYHILRPLKREV